MESFDFYKSKKIIKGIESFICLMNESEAYFFNEVLETEKQKIRNYEKENIQIIDATKTEIGLFKSFCFKKIKMEFPFLKELNYYTSDKKGLYVWNLFKKASEKTVLNSELMSEYIVARRIYNNAYENHGENCKPYREFCSQIFENIEIKVIEKFKKENQLLINKYLNYETS
jgi:hypothetical protein